MGRRARARCPLHRASRRCVYVALLRRVTAQAAGVLTFLEPVAGVLLAWALLREHPVRRRSSGGALVLAAGLAVVLLTPSETVGGRGAGRGRIGRRMSADPARTPPDRNLALELVRVTEAAAMGAVALDRSRRQDRRRPGRRRPDAPDGQLGLDAGRRRDRRGREGRGADALQRRGDRRRDAARRSTSPSTRSRGRASPRSGYRVRSR